MFFSTAPLFFFSEHDILATGLGRVAIFAPDFSVRWEAPAGNISEAKMLPNGNVLFADNRVVEVAPDKTQAVIYKPESKEGSFTCSRLPNGNTLVGENSSGKVMEIAPDGSVAFTLQTRFVTEDQHHRLRYVRKLANGNYLVCHSGDHLVREYTPEGETIWEQKVPNIAFCTLRLENGNTLISSLDQITEFTKDGKIVWEFKNSDLPDLGIRNMTGFQKRKNGNLLIGCYAAYDEEGRGVGMFEITPEKKLVWAYRKPTDGRKVDQNMMGVEMLEEK
jgi:outer membrane protein assembly factor BamB